MYMCTAQEGMQYKQWQNWYIYAANESHIEQNKAIITTCSCFPETSHFLIYYE